MNHELKLKRSVIAVALAVAAVPMVHAQEAAATEPAVQRVVVTGSNIKRGIDEQTASPVQIIGRAEIQAMGASTVKDIVDTITSNTGALTDLGSSNSFASGATGLSLRNLGKGSTLTLLNGRRVSNFGTADGGQQTFVNIDSIPSEVIERVEVLLDGASAIYGSDAVAGVVNIITKKEFRGGAVRAGYRQSLTKSQLDKDQTASLTYGKGDFGADGYNVFAHLELFHRTPYTDREIESQVPQWYKDYVNPAFGVKSTYSVPGNYFGRYPANYSDAALRNKTIGVAAPGCAPVNLTNGLCYFDQYAKLGIHAEAERANFISSGRFRLNENLTAFAELTLSDTNTIFYAPPPIMQYTGSPSRWYNAKEKKLMFYTEPMLPTGHYYNPYSFPIQLRYRYADEDFKQEAHAQQYRALVGLEGNHFGWDWNAAMGTMANKSDNVDRGLKHATNYLNAVLSGEYKFGQKNSPELLMRMFPEYSFNGKSSQTFIDWRGSRELMQLQGGPLSLAVGAEYRRDSFESFVSDNVANAELVGLGSINVVGKRNMYAAFAEMAAPITKKIEINGAVRADKVGDTDVSLVPKLGARFQPFEQLILRGTYSHGFRAPNNAETGKVALSAFQNSIQDPKRCATAQALYNELRKGTDIDIADANTARASGCTSSAAVDIAGNPALEPEKSKSLTFGLGFQPTKTLSMTLDYYRIERRNEIDTPAISQILAREDLEPGLVNRLPVTEQDRKFSDRVKELTGKDIKFTVGPLSSISQRYANMNRSRVSGLDFDLTHQSNLGAYGKLVNRLRANYQLDYRRWDTVTDTFTENLVGNYGNYRYTARASSQWTKGEWTVGGTLTYTPSTRLIDDRYDEFYTPEGCADQGFEPQHCVLPKDAIVDMNVSYTGFKNLTISAYMTNVFNREMLIDPRMGDPDLRGRTLRLTAEYSF